MKNIQVIIGKEKQEEIINEIFNLLFQNIDMIMLKRSKRMNQFVSIYEEIAEITSREDAIAIYEKFRGLQIAFPRRLYSTEYVSAYVKEHYNGKNLKELAQHFEYSERRIREFLKG